MISYRREIDGLRALAVLPVIFFHAGFKAFSGGFVGVDVFFVISGYLITSVILSEKAAGTFSLLNFYERRARRILPALFLVMLSCIPFAWAWLLPNDMKDFSESLSAVALFVSNHLFLSESGYFDTAGELKPLLHTWSLALEEQYYLLFPLFIKFMWRYEKKYTVYALSLLSLISLFLAQWASYKMPSEAFYTLPTRWWELAIGALLAFFFSRFRSLQLNRSFSQIGSALGFALILFAIFTYNQDTPFPGLYALSPTVGAVLIILLAGPNTLVGKILATDLLVGIGLISYSAYLWHQPIFAFARHRSSTEPSSTTFAILILLTIVLAYFSWRFVEQFFRKKELVSQKMIFSGASFFSVFFIFAGLLGHLYGGFEGRFKKILDGDIGHLEFHRYIDEKYFNCEPKAVAEQALQWEGFLRCKQSKRGAPDVVLLGDSHAEHLFIGLAEAKANLNVAFYIRGGNAFVSNPEFKVIFDELLSNKKAQKILLAMHYVSRAVIDQRKFFNELSDTVAQLKGAGKSVVLLGDIPKYKIDPGRCVFRNEAGKSEQACSLSIGELTAQKRVFSSALSEISLRHHVPYFEIEAPVCSASGCSMYKDNTILYRDQNHLNIPGSQLVGLSLANTLPF